MTRSALVALCIIMPIAPSAADGGVPIEVLRSDFACRDLSDMVRLGLRRLDGDKAGFLDFYNAHQAVGSCEPLRAGTIGLLQDSHDEQGLHFDCIKQADDPVCFWSVSPAFGLSP